MLVPLINLNSYHYNEDFLSDESNKQRINREIILDSGMEPGEWRIDRLFIQDKAGNSFF